MELLKCLAVLAVLCVDAGEGGGGHGEKHHDHLRIHIPKFIHHDHHKKMITIHHHHAKPKENHHHHHHHHKKVVHVPQHHHHVKKTHHTESKHTSSHHGGHGHHGHHGHHHGHHKHHGHHGHGHGHHHDDFPAVSYGGPSGFVEEEYTPYSPPADTYPGVPQVHGIQHTVKQVKVYDSLPGVIPQNNGHGGGYQVTEEAEDDDSFSPVNGIQQAFPATYGYLRGAAPQQSHDPFPELTPQSQGNPYAGSVAQPSVTFGGSDSYSGGGQNDPFAASGPSQGDGFDDPANSYVGDVNSTPLLAADEAAGNDDGSVSYHHQRAAGVQQVVQTGGSEVITY
ncbi:hypothetical protein O0L34_g2509 [Tuta absoluta]|nr:hypothetical protein O0L34_g2509 [Tuta absoluta]